MKKIWIAVFLVAFGAVAWGQKIGYIDTEYILQQMPEYQKAEAELNKAIGAWRSEINTRRQELIKAQREYEAEAILLNDRLKAERLAKIEGMQKAIQDYQNNIFGQKGLLFNKRRELVNPIQEKVYEAVEKIAKQRNIQFLFDKAVDLFIIYSNPKHNYSDDVLEALGIKKPASDDSEDSENGN